MRSLRTLTVAAGLAGMAPALASAQYTPEQVLAFTPALPGVDIEIPRGEAIKACKVENVSGADNAKLAGFALRDSQGKLLRKFVDNDGDRKLDQWSYYKDGFEVYREVDLNRDRALDECRFMNAGGTRIAVIKSVKVGDRWTPKVASWKRISAEEASKELVQALVSGDLGLLESVMAKPEELAELGLPKGMIDQVAEAAAKRNAQFLEVRKGLKGWGPQTVWSRLDGQMPHLIPADPGTKLKDDLVLLENAVIFPGTANGQGNPENMVFLQAPEMIKLGDTWKFVELPRPVDPTKPLLAAEGGIRSWLFREQANGAGPANNAALDALAKYDQANANAVAKADVAKFHRGRIDMLRDVIRTLKTPDEQLVFEKQVVDSLAAAYQTGLYPAAAQALDRQAAAGGKLGSYAAFRKIFAEFAAKNDEGGNVLANQKKWMAELKGFVDKYPQSEEAPDALLQLASAHEYNAEEDEAKTYYQALASNFADSDQGKKAAGALRRLDLVGKTLELKGKGMNNEVIDVASYRGKPLLVTFWASWAEPVKRDLPELVKSYEKHHPRGFEIIGVCVDEKAEDVEQFLKANPLRWPQIYEAGGLEKNPLASGYGIIALPTMILVDAQGKVVNRNIRSAAELETQLEKLLSAKDGVAFGDK